jgi:hypothetical protein
MFHANFVSGFRSSFSINLHLMFTFPFLPLPVLNPSRIVEVEITSNSLHSATTSVDFGDDLCGASPLLRLGAPLMDVNSLLDGPPRRAMGVAVTTRPTRGLAVRTRMLCTCSMPRKYFACVFYTAAQLSRLGQAE